MFPNIPVCSHEKCESSHEKQESSHEMWKDRRWSIHTSGWSDDIQHGALGNQPLVVDHLHLYVVAGAEVEPRDVVHHL